MVDAASFVPAQDTHSMPLMAHLGELRKRIIFSVLGVIVGFLACWSYADRIFGLVQQPLIRALLHHGLSGGLVYLNPTEPFNLYKPLFWRLGSLPGYSRPLHSCSINCGCSSFPDCIARKSGVMFCRFSLSAVGLFIAGGFLGYKMVYPASLDLLIGYGLRF
jgi:sec-independent protein translocase protein TatC